MGQFNLSGNIVDLVQRKIFPGTITVNNGLITSITPTPNETYPTFILPGFIDAHVHVESSMLIPSEFARLAVCHGTVATISDPHEIGNVLGLEGVRFMLKNGSRVPFHFYFGAPSCVPATSFETSGATLSAADIRTLFVQDKLKYLSEMMNYPGVLSRHPLVMDKIRVAQELGLPIDGHAPGLMGEEAAQYIAAGISTDHECFTLAEALDKIKYGMKIIIREGSAAKNYEALHSLIHSHADKVMFCSDDKHPHELVEGHINLLVKRSIVAHNYDSMDVLRCACYNPVKHYNLDVGLLQKGDSADFIVVDNLQNLAIEQTYIKGQLVAEHGKTLIASVPSDVINAFHIAPKKEADFVIHSPDNQVQVIRVLDGQLVTEHFLGEAKKQDGTLISDTARDILKLAVINRYTAAPVAMAFINGFGLKQGALASCIAHDSHNIIAVGVDDKDLCAAVNALIENKGGIAVASQNKVETLPLPIGGIMSHQDGYEIAKKYARIDHQAKELGTPLFAPFMTLSFMALLVIPSLKLSDKGLFDGTAFRFTPLIIKK
ncbi:MAG: adenine deaminase [Parachlamydia sp.]|nr:MAG: adenine deaminase [Parachlamydia sp.]